ncbi:MAG: HNH endonuclease [Methanobrevibacter sp.]|nr:HNH endonuclease [Methanobrevibacter sp.]
MEKLMKKHTVSYEELLDFSKLVLDYDSILKENEELKKYSGTEELKSVLRIIKFLNSRISDKRHYSHWYQGSYEGYVAHFRCCNLDIDYIESVTDYENQPHLVKSIIDGLSYCYINYYRNLCSLENYGVKLHLAKYKRDEEIRVLSSEIRFLKQKLNNFVKEYRPVTKIEIIGADEYVLRTSQEYSQFKKNVLSRDYHTCQCCGSKDNPEVHHKYAMNQHNSLGATVSNGIVLCEKCHKEYHYQYGWKDNCNPVNLKKFIKQYWNQSPLNNYNHNPENMHLKEKIAKLEKIISEKDAEIKQLSDIDYMRSRIKDYEFNHSKEKELEDLKIKEYDKKYANSNVFDLVKNGIL